MSSNCPLRVQNLKCFLCNTPGPYYIEFQSRWIRDTLWDTGIKDFGENKGRQYSTPPGCSLLKNVYHHLCTYIFTHFDC